MKNQIMLGKAIAIATQSHYKQFDRGGNPYILHPIAVMYLTHSSDEEIKCIAILHDVPEDTDITLEFLKSEGFSTRVLAAVDILTKKENQTYKEYMDLVFTNRDAMIVKRADLEHNSNINRLKGVKQKDLDRIKRYHEFFMAINEKLNTPG